MHSLSAPLEQIGQLRALLASPKRCVIVTHYNPDGDAMGSALGLMHLLNALGHSAQVVLPNTPPGFLHWMPGYDTTLALDRDKTNAEVMVRDAEVLFCLDFNRTDRVGGLEDALKAALVKVLIDHHQEPEDFAMIAFSDTEASSTCQMVADIAEAMGVFDQVDKYSATCLYTGIVTDSGSFRYSSTTPHTMRVAADLIEKGVEVAVVHESILNDERASRLKLLGFALNERMEVLPELGTAIMHLTKDDLKRFDYQAGDTEGFVNYGLTIRGIRLAALFMERPDVVKVSLRSRGDLAVDRFLKEHFNGGGHRNAAGGNTKESLSQALARFKTLLPSLVAQGE